MVYARTTVTHVQPNMLDETIRVYHDSIVPAAKQQQGFQNLFLLTDRATGKCMTISLWETESHLKATEDNGFFQQQIAKLAPYLTASPMREIYEVSVPAIDSVRRWP